MATRDEGNDGEQGSPAPGNRRHGGRDRRGTGARPKRHPIGTTAGTQHLDRARGNGIGGRRTSKRKIHATTDGRKRRSGGSHKSGERDGGTGSQHRHQGDTKEE